jgi:hypothetical protein
MDNENKFAEITARLNELNTARALDQAKLEAKLQEIHSAMQSLQDEISKLTTGDGSTIAFS